MSKRIVKEYDNEEKNNEKSIAKVKRGDLFKIANIKSVSL